MVAEQSGSLEDMAKKKNLEAFLKKVIVWLIVLGAAAGLAQ